MIAAFVFTLILHNSSIIFRTYKSATQQTINKSYKSRVHKTVFCIGCFTHSSWLAAYNSPLTNLLSSKHYNQNACYRLMQRANT